MVTESAEPVTATWTERPKRLKFSVAGILLHAMKFRALILDVPYNRLPTDPGQLRPPLNALTSKAPAAFVYSHPLETKLPRVTFLPQAIRYAPSQYRRFYVDIRGSFAEYLKKFPSQPRYNLRRRVQKFAEICGGAIPWAEFRHPREMPEFHRLAREVSRKTYQERQLDAGLPDGDDFVERITDLARRGAVRGYILFHREAPIAYKYCVVTDDVLSCEKTGYDPQFRQSHPGIVLLYLTLEKLFAEGQFRQFDFGRGEYSYKEFFATGNIHCADIYFFRRTLGNLLLLLAHNGLHMASGAIGAALERFDLKITFQRLIRRRKL